MAILTKAGRVAMAKAVAKLPIFMCWGQGETSWGDTPPTESIAATDLKDVVGYRKAASVQYCEPNETGDIVIPSGKFSVSEAATHHLYLRFVFDFEDAKGKTIREIGVVVGTATKEGLPAGQYYFAKDQVETPGDLLLLEHRKPLHREVGVRETFEFVVSF